MSTDETMVTGMKHSLFVLKSLVSKDFKLKYRRSILGVLWSVLNPLLMMIVLSAVFSFMFRFQIENYPLYLILGQVLFSLMTDATTSAMTSIIDASPLLKKVRVEKMVFPLEKVVFGLVNFAISLIAVLAVMVFFQVIPTWRVLLIPVMLIFVSLFCVGLGLLLSSLAVFSSATLFIFGSCYYGVDVCNAYFLPPRATAGHSAESYGVEPDVSVHHLFPRHHDEWRHA